MRALGFVLPALLLAGSAPEARPREPDPEPPRPPGPTPSGGFEPYWWDAPVYRHPLADVQRERARGDRQRRQGRKPWKGRP